MAYAWASAGSSATTASGTSMTVSATYAAHDRVQIHLTYGIGSTVTESVSDGTNTYNRVGTTLNDATTNQSNALFECLDAAAGTFTVTFGLATAQTFRGIAYTRQSGLSNSIAAQAVRQVAAAPGTGTDATSSTNVTPASQPGMLMGLAADATGPNTVNSGTGFTNEGAITNWDSVLGDASRMEDKRLTATTAVAATFTATVGTDRIAVYGIFIPEPGGAVATFPPVPSVLNSLPTLLTM